METMYHGYRIEIKKVYEVYRGNNRIASAEIKPSDNIENIIKELKLWIDKKEMNKIQIKKEEDV